MSQYIGARYVPKFMGTYNNTQAYENMVVVDNGMGTSYISKVPVPAGTPLTDTNYWALYGASNGAIINLQNQIGDLSSLTTSANSDLVSAVNEVDGEILSLTNRLNKKYIFIGDSYGQRSAFTYPVWTELVPSYLGLSNSDYYWSAVSGAGFVGNGIDFLAVLQLLTISEPNDISDIYVLGGINDVVALSASAIENAISTFCSYCNSTFPNAKVHIGVISQNTDGVNQYKMGGMILPAYKACGKYGADFVNGIDFIASYSLLNSDGSHPNQTGQEVLSQYIANYILGGYSGTKHNIETFALTKLDASDSIGPSNEVITCEENGTYKLASNKGGLYIIWGTAKTFAANTAVTIAKIDNDLGCFPHGDGNFSTTISFYIKQSGSWDNAARVGSLKYNGVNGELSLTSPCVALGSVEGVYLPAFMFISNTYGT